MKRIKWKKKRADQIERSSPQHGKLVFNANAKLRRQIILKKKKNKINTYFSLENKIAF